MDLKKKIINMAKSAKAASQQLSLISTAEKNRALNKMAAALIKEKAYLVRENKKSH